MYPNVGVRYGILASDVHFWFFKLVDVPGKEAELHITKQLKVKPCLLICYHSSPRCINKRYLYMVSFCVLIEHALYNEVAVITIYR